MKEILMKKGYTLEVTSWENDADNYKTKSIHLGLDEERAKALLKMCKELFESHHSGNCVGIGNMMEDDYEEAVTKIQNYLRVNTPVLRALEWYYGDSLDVDDDDGIHDMVLADFNYDIMGSSEYYCSRVFDKGRVMYTEEDITVDVLVKADRYDK